MAPCWFIQDVVINGNRCETTSLARRRMYKTHAPRYDRTLMIYELKASESRAKYILRILSTVQSAGLETTWGRLGSGSFRALNVLCRFTLKQCPTLTSVTVPLPPSKGNLSFNCNVVKPGCCVNLKKVRNIIQPAVVVSDTRAPGRLEPLSEIYDDFDVKKIMVKHREL